MTEYPAEVKTVKYVKLGMFTALAMALSWIERFIPFVPVAPGMKIGLANIILMLVLELYGVKSALTVNVIRSLLSAALFGGIMSLPYSLSGGICAVMVMWIIKKLKGTSLTGVAIGGAFAHNIAQITVACIIMQTYYIFTYLPVLGATAIVTGMFTGVCARLCVNSLKNIRL